MLTIIEESILKYLREDKSGEWLISRGYKWMTGKTVVKPYTITLNPGEVVLTPSRVLAILRLGKESYWYAVNVIRQLVKKGCLKKIEGKSIRGQDRTNVYLDVYANSMHNKINELQESHANNCKKEENALSTTDGRNESASTHRYNWFGRTNDGRKISINESNYFDLLDSDDDNVRSQAINLQAKLLDEKWEASKYD